MMADTDAREENEDDLGKDVLLIELYEAEPALWDVHSAAYRDKYERKKSVDRIDSIMKIGADKILKKVNNLRTYYKKRLIKLIVPREVVQGYMTSTRVNGPCSYRWTSFLDHKFKKENLIRPLIMDEKNMVRSSLLHKSKWLLGIFHDCDLSEMETNSSSDLDNVAVIQYPTSLLNKYQQNELNLEDSVRKVFKHMSVLNNSNPETLTEAAIEGLYDWKPFIVHDIKTNNYTGFSIDLLQELAHELNFTYEITSPPDGQWGTETPNGSWTGLDVDIVAAPLTIQTDRERVIDFTYPYFYEPSVILIKKPDPNLTKWRTLIDPFSTTVLLCIFISLPISSLFLLFFEKYNPYYRKVEDRSKVTGLHHFSDSFWYMYGALLTQGGAHMADSSSGRTLLSFWWIFCIIMMATYSGNLIAFLTVTKEKLPFTDLSGLVAQDKYQWGIQGGAIFEQIFKTSEIPEYKKIWSGVVEYNKSDTRVLSYIGDEHIGKVLEGNYAFIVDKTFFDMTMIDNCELAMTLAEVLQLQYAMALPNNSPFTKIFTDEIISIHESGLLQIWRLRHWPKPGNCKESILKESNAITLIDVQSAFYLIGIGIFVASCSLCMEFCKHKYCKWREKIGKGKEKPQMIRHVSTTPKLDVHVSY
ncbi:GRID1 [Mytilus edulis]|uniref:GRID1 n=1 Tax=Mytilus edulis TaxID=6550 RepID=A0A8S3S5T8_MYTED|nr:GRID1 [Mytilus edulis]